MSFDHDFVILFPFFLPSLKKREEKKENELAKIVIKGPAILLDPSAQEGTKGVGEQPKKVGLKYLKKDTTIAIQTVNS